MPRHPLDARLRRLEHTGGNTAACDAAADQFAARFTTYVDRLAGREPAPGMSPLMHLACRAPAEPEAVATELHALAQQAIAELEQQPLYRRWQARQKG